MEGMLHCAKQEIVIISPYLLNHYVLQIKDRIGNSLYHAACLPDRFVPGKVESSSNSLSLTQTP